MHWLLWFLRRAAVFPFVWALAHATIFAWQAIDPSYLKWAQWTADAILKPMHPMVVWITKQLVPALETFVQNTQPTHHDAPKVFYPLFMAIYGLVSTGVWFGTKSVIRRLRPVVEPLQGQVIAPRPQYRTLKERLEKVDMT